MPQVVDATAPDPALVALRATFRELPRPTEPYRLSDADRRYIAAFVSAWRSHGNVPFGAKEICCWARHYAAAIGEQRPPVRLQTPTAFGRLMRANKEAFAALGIVHRDVYGNRTRYDLAATSEK